MSTAYLRIRGDVDRAHFATQITDEQARQARFCYRMFRRIGNCPHAARFSTWAVILIPWGDAPPPAPRLRSVQ